MQNSKIDQVSAIINVHNI